MNNLNQKKINNDNRNRQCLDLDFLNAKTKFNILNENFSLASNHIHFQSNFFFCATNKRLKVLPHIYRYNIHIHTHTQPSQQQIDQDLIIVCVYKDIEISKMRLTKNPFEIFGKFCQKKKKIFFSYFSFGLKKFLNPAMLSAFYFGCWQITLA